MKAKRKRAESMDDMLKRCYNEPNFIYQYPEMTKEELGYLNTTARLLIDDHFLKRFMSQTINVSITDKGKIFVESGNSFVKQIDQEIERERLYKIKLEQEEVAHQVNKSALSAAKREPWLIAWTIISTLAALVLAYIQYIKG